ncbi:MAG: hypothetical protein ACRD5L_12540, partial [Bryobacteraceae bacterium]
ASFEALPPNGSEGAAQQVCYACGLSFAALPAENSEEQLCDACERGQFEPVRIRHWQRIPARITAHARHSR